MHNKTDTVIALPGRLDLNAAEPLHHALLEWARDGSAIVVDARGVEQVSTAAIQVLLAAAADARLRGVSFSYRDPSEMLTQAFSDLGIPTELITA